MTVHQYRKNGWKVRVLHFRNFQFGSDQPLPRGGRTNIELTTPDKKSTVIGVALCCDDDNYNKKIGVRIALGRAKKLLEQLKEGKDFQKEYGREF